MNSTRLFNRFAPVIRSVSALELVTPEKIDSRLLLASNGPVSMYYAPFDWINEDARIVIVGITPGRTQMMNAIAEAHRQLRAGADDLTALKCAKQVGAFSGPLRPNLVGMLDYFGLNRWLKLSSTMDLFGVGSKLLHTTSVLRFPTFVENDNFNGAPHMLKTPFLRDLVDEHFVPQLRVFQNAVFVPLGERVGEVIESLVQRGVVNPDRVLSGLPHPSGANAERVNYLIERKVRGALSKKTDAGKLDSVRLRFAAAVTALT